MAEILRRELDQQLDRDVSLREAITLALIVSSFGFLSNSALPMLMF